ncbi:MAG: caspase family protein, partial [Terriglobales bacterium]
MNFAVRARAPSGPVLVAGLLTLVLCAGDAFAQAAPRGAAPTEHQGKRYALVIGNTFYEPPIESLVNPKKDARDMCATLRRVGFEAQCFENIKTRREMEE